VGAEPGASALSLPTTTSAALEGRAADVASRSASRAAQVPAPAVSAPADAAPAAPDQVGVSGVKAVAKPKPKPKPKPTVEEESSSSSSSSSSSRPGVKVSGVGISSRCSGIGLVNDAARLCTAVHANFNPSSIGGFRAGAGEHGTGHAVDIMITSGSQGDAIAAFVQANVGTFDVKYLIWQQRYWAPGEGWSMMEDRGSPTQNHMDHVHVTVN